MNRTAVCLIACALSCNAFAGDNARPAGEPVLERPTLHCLGAHWIIEGDDNQNAQVAVEYRRSGEAAWRQGYPLFRVEKGAHRDEKYGSQLNVPQGAWLFAGSIVQLEPDAEYQMRLTLVDPDGGKAQRTLAARTRAEPVAAKDAPTYHVIPGQGGGSGTAGDPFKGLAAAQERAKPGDLFLLGAGKYNGTFAVKRSGEPGKPIIWRGAGDGEAIIDGQGTETKRPGVAISASGVRDVWFEGLTVRNADWGIVAHEAARLVIRRCRIDNVDYGITATRDNGRCEDFFIADNVIEGPSTWPRTKGIEDARGIQVAGAGHVVCYNRIRGFADAIDTFPSQRVEAIDFHNNDISEMTDDGIEMDYSQRNTRCFENRITNVFHGISIQPVWGGPVYIFRNAMYNSEGGPFKMHNSPSGVLIFQNTSVRTGSALVTMTSATVRNVIYRNNLFIGTAGPYAYEAQPKMVNCDFDFDGFGGGPWKQFLKWNGKRYATFEQMKAEAPIYRHAVRVDPATAFASGAVAPANVKAIHTPPDLRLAPKSAAIDAGVPLPGFSNDAPDLGAHELGGPRPHYGPRPPGSR